MKKAKLFAGIVLALAAGSVHAGIRLNTVGAVLIYPGVAAARIGQSANIETFLTITNTSTDALVAHVSFIDGDAGTTRYCSECDFDVPLTGLDTEVLVLQASGLGFTEIVNLDTGASRSCHQSVGFVVVDLEDAGHTVLTRNVLLGSEVVVDYAAGSAFSVPAIPSMGGLGDGNRELEFDNVEYGTFPSVVGADFLAPDAGGAGLDANLILLTLAFERGFPPLTDCSVVGFDAFEAQFSSSLQFGCWTLQALGDIAPEFLYPYLGGIGGDEHGWLQVACTVHGTDKNLLVQGGVHGAITQFAPTGTVLRRNDGGPALASAAGWARLLYQSGTSGDPMFLTLGNAAHGGTF